jgi:hypothetical protein
LRSEARTTQNTHRCWNPSMRARMLSCAALYRRQLQMAVRLGASERFTHQRLQRRGIGSSSSSRSSGGRGLRRRIVVGIVAELLVVTLILFLLSTFVRGRGEGRTEARSIADELILSVTCATERWKARRLRRCLFIQHRSRSERPPSAAQLDCASAVSLAAISLCALYALVSSTGRSGMILSSSVTSSISRLCSGAQTGSVTLRCAYTLQ